MISALLLLSPAVGRGSGRILEITSRCRIGIRGAKRESKMASRFSTTRYLEINCRLLILPRLGCFQSLTVQHVLPRSAHHGAKSGSNCVNFTQYTFASLQILAALRPRLHQLGIPPPTGVVTLPRAEYHRAVRIGDVHNADNCWDDLRGNSSRIHKGRAVGRARCHMLGEKTSPRLRDRLRQTVLWVGVDKCQDRSQQSAHDRSKQLC